jgi:hypothetical protein
MQCMLHSAGAHRAFATNVVVTELVSAPDDEQVALQPIELDAMNDVARSDPHNGTAGGTHGCGSSPPDPQPPAQAQIHRLWCRRLGPRSLSDVPMLAAAAQTLAPRLARLPTVWTPPAPPRWLSQQQQSQQDYSGRNYVAAEGLFWDLHVPHGGFLGEPQGAGRWAPGERGSHPPPPPPGSPGHLRVLAAQLQHRVPCWGYAMQAGGRCKHAG